MICCLCDCEFRLSKKPAVQEKLLFKEHHNDKEYICEQCYEERLTSDYRIVEGQYLCINKECVRNRMAFSNFCDICDRGFKNE